MKSRIEDIDPIETVAILAGLLCNIVNYVLPRAS
jgi:hypothetical protein